MKIKDFTKSHKTFFSILFTITIIVLFVAIVLSSILYFDFKNISLNYVNNTNLRFLSQVSSSLNYIDESAINFSMSTSVNNDVKTLLYMKSNNYYLVSQIFPRIKQLVKSGSYIHSIYLYNSTLEQYYSTFFTPICPKNEFLDKEVNELVSRSNKSEVKLIPRRIPASYSNAPLYENVYTYVFFDNTISGNTNNDAIIVNLKSSWLINQMNTLSTSGKRDSESAGKLLVIDNSGKIVSHPDEKMFLKDISNESYVNKILTSKNSSGYFIDNVDNKKSIITYISPENKIMLKWSFISIIPYETIDSQLNNIKNVTIITCASILILGLIMAFILSRKVYSPINQLVLNVRNMLHLSHIFEKNTDELNFISEEFLKTIDKVKLLEDYKRSTILSSKNNMLVKVILDTPENVKKIESDFKEFDIDINPLERIRLIVLRIDRYSSFLEAYNKKDNSIIRSAIHNLADEVLSNHFKCTTIDMGTDHFVILANTPDEDSIEMQQLICTISELQSSCLQNFNVSVSSAISNTLPDIMEITALYRETLDLSNYKLIWGHNCIITPDRIDYTSIHKYSYPFEKHMQLINNLKLGNIQQVTNIFKELADNISGFSYSNIILSYNYLASSVFSTLNLIQSNSTFTFELDYPSFINKISILETIDEINSYFYELFETIYKNMNTAKKEKNKVIIESIIHIIIHNYMDTNLSLESIADTLKLSPDHIGRMFKEYTACSISDFVTNTRLEKAKELLAKSNFSVDEIASKVGFTYSKYFYKVFKKSFGVTPKEYRLKSSIVI